MQRLFLFLLLLAAVGLSPSAWADELPPRPSPFRFVNDQAQLLSPADAETLENGLRRYADNTGTQLVVVTVPSLGGRQVADYARDLGTAWGVGQREKNNGLVLLISSQERQVSIQAGTGLQDRITPAVTNRVITEQLTPSFKQGRYFAGLRAGLNTLMLAANPSSDPRQNAPANAASGEDIEPEVPSDLGASLPEQGTTTPEPAYSPVATTPAPSSGWGLGTLALGAVAVLGGIWLISKLFRRQTTSGRATVPTAPTATPDFLPTQPAGRPAGSVQQPSNQPGPTPDFLSNRSKSSGNGGSGSGMGGMLMTGAAAAAGAYLGNRMAHGHEAPNTAPLGSDSLSRSSDANLPSAGAAAPGGFPALGGSDATADTGPDYFSDSAAPAEGPDYFSDSKGSSSYDDLSSDDTGGGGFEDDNDNSGSW